MFCEIFCFWFYSKPTSLCVFVKMANIHKEDNLELKLNSNKMRKRLLIIGMMFWVIANFHAQTYSNKVGITLTLRVQRWISFPKAVPLQPKH